MFYVYFIVCDDNWVVLMLYCDGCFGLLILLFIGIFKVGNYNGGWLVFGLDGMLYVIIGDVGECFDV